MHILNFCVIINPANEFSQKKKEWKRLIKRDNFYKLEQKYVTQRVVR